MDTQEHTSVIRFLLEKLLAGHGVVTILCLLFLLRLFPKLLQILVGKRLPEKEQLQFGWILVVKGGDTNLIEKGDHELPKSQP